MKTVAVPGGWRRESHITGLTVSNKKLPYLSCPLGSQNSHANVRDPEKQRQSFKRRNKVKNLLAGFQNLSQSEGNREIWLKEQIYSYKMNKFWGSNAQPCDYR